MALYHSTTTDQTMITGGFPQVFIFAQVQVCGSNSFTEKKNIRTYQQIRMSLKKLKLPEKL